MPGQFYSIPKTNNLAVVSTGNSSTTILNASATFTGKYEATENFPSVIIACLTDQEGTLYVDYSTDGVTAQSTLSYDVLANTNEVHRLTNTRAYFRIRFTNTSANNQTSFSLQVTFGNFQLLTSNLSNTIQQDQDALVVRPTISTLEVASGRFLGIDIVSKFGKNSDVDTGSVPEDIWGNGGTYTGFPTGSPETLECFSSSASDTGVLTISGLKTSSSTAIESESVTLNGTTPVTTVNTWYRAHTARYSSGSETGLNVGLITIRHSTTTANVFLLIDIGTSQSYSTGFTVPAGKTGYITQVLGSLQGSTSGVVDLALWVRTFGSSPRIRRPFTISQNAPIVYNIAASIICTEKSDIVIRATSASTQNLSVLAGYDIYLVDN
jgi:hypothetical protein